MSTVISTNSGERQRLIPATDLEVHRSVAFALDRRAGFTGQYLIFVPDPLCQFLPTGGRVPEDQVLVERLGGGDYEVFDRVLSEAVKLRDRLQGSYLPKIGEVTPDLTRLIVTNAITFATSLDLPPSKPFSLSRL